MASTFSKLVNFLHFQSPTTLQLLLSSRWNGITRIYRQSSSFSTKTQTKGSEEETENKIIKSKPEKNPAQLPDEVVFHHPQHDMYICWHPEVSFPYEMSKPLPLDAHGTESSLRIQSLEPVKEVFRKKDFRLVTRELMKLTYTPKYGWEGRHGRKIKMVKKEMDPLKQKRSRPYL